MIKSIQTELPEIMPHPDREVVLSLGAARVAKALNVTTNYLYQILSGTHPGSETVRNRLSLFIEKAKAGEIRQ